MNTVSCSNGRPRRFLKPATMPSPVSVLPPAVKRYLAGGALALATAVLLAVPACGRPEQVELSGAVFDPSMSRIPHAFVVLTEQERRVIEAVTAGADGSFRIGGLPASASYEIEVRGPPGFETVKHRVDLSTDRQQDFELDVEPVVEAIVISSPPRDSLRSGGPRRRVRVGGSLRKARLTHYEAPAFPADAVRQGVGGTVLLEGVIGEEGRVVGLSMRNSIADDRLVAAASDAVRQWRYDPTLLNGQPVDTVVNISVAFEIP